MTTYTPDLDLRRRAAEAAGVKPSGMTDFRSQHGDEYPKFDISLDAILPLVRELDDPDFMAFHRAMREICAQSYSLDYFDSWLTRKATPADYCRAFLAAKGEKE